jgi:hypothetical protein
MIWRALTWPFIALFALAASWFGGRNAANADTKLDTAEQRLFEALRAKEIENEVEALRPDALRERARKWVRKTNR